MAGKHLRNRNIAVVENISGCADNSEVDEVSCLEDTTVNQGPETERTVMPENEENNAGSIITTEVGVGMSPRQLQDILTKALSTLRTDITEQLDSKLQVVTENITVKIREENEKLSQKLYEEVKKLSTDIWNSEQANWQDKAGGELDKVKDNVKSVEDRVTEIEAAAQNSIQKPNAEITYLWGQIASRQVMGSAMPSQALPVAAVDVEISSQLDFEVAAGVGNYHMGNCNANNCSTTVGGNATAQQNAIVNVKSDVFANNSHMNELTLPTFHDSSNQIALHFLRDLDEYYRIINVPEPLKLPLPCGQ